MGSSTSYPCSPLCGWQRSKSHRRTTISAPNYSFPPFLSSSHSSTLPLLPTSLPPALSSSLRVLFLTPRGAPPLRYKGGWLFTSPLDEQSLLRDDLRHPLVLTSSETDINSLHAAETKSAKMVQVMYCNHDNHSRGTSHYVNM